jgi:hypothetical protein
VSFNIDFDRKDVGNCEGFRSGLEMKHQLVSA